MLNKEELRRYNRHIILSEIGMQGQLKLKTSKVLVVGAGGLGCPVLQYLTAAGVGNIGIIDFDIIDESNLQRQILYDTNDIGKLKAEVAAKKLKAQNPYIELQPYHIKLTKDNALDIIKEYDIVVDGSDNFSTRYLVGDACAILGKPLVFGSIFKFEGQVSVFNLKNKKGEAGPTYRCLYPDAPNVADVPNCSEIGVLGVLPGIVGSIQANEVIKIIIGIGEPLSGRLLVFDALQMNFSLINFTANPENFKLKELQEYKEENCEVNSFAQEAEITVQELKIKTDRKENFALIDVREPHEYEICNLGGKLIPMNSIQNHVHEIPTEKPVVVYCHHGMRSAMIVKFLREEFGFKNLYNLEGGIHAWAMQVDKEMMKY